MLNKLAPLRGMKDLLPDDFRVHKHIEQTALKIAELYGYEAFSTPLLEYASVFDRTLGDSSDVVSKEMYSFIAKNGDLIALRPEFTAGIIRAFISNGLKQKLPLKLFSAGAVFRYDRPQKGRQRQFHQINFEYIGAVGAYSDAETIALAAHILDELNVLPNVDLQLNSLGCTESRKNYQLALIEYFNQYFDELSENSKLRLDKNPLRILDSKSETDQKISQDAPLIADYYTIESAKYFDEVQSYLDKMQIKYVLNPKLVRGLDYYSHTAFEFVTNNDRLGSQATVLAGGRYDGLIALMGESEIPSIGFAAGIERLALMQDFDIKKTSSVFIIPIGDSCMDYAIELTNKLRKANIQICLELNGKINKRMQKALTENAKYIIFIGESEMHENIYKLKNLASNEEKEVTYTKLLGILTNK